MALTLPRVFYVMSVGFWSLILDLLCSIQSISVVSEIKRKLGNRYRAWKFLTHGPEQIREGYAKANGKPYEVDVPESRYWFIPPGKFNEEINQYGSTDLSMYTASRTMFMPQYSMRGFNWHDQRGKYDIGFTKILWGISGIKMPNMMSTLLTTISHEMEIEKARNSKYVAGAQHTAVYPMIIRLVARINSRMFFGKEATQDDENFESAVDFIEDVFRTAEFLRILPGWLIPIIGGIISRNNSRQQKLFKILMAITEQRLEAKTMRTGNERKEDIPNDCLQWVIDTSPKKNPWTAERIVHEVMALWFGALHALSMSLTYAMFDICAQDQYVPALRDELEGPEYIQFMETAKGLPILDSFMRESARLTPFEVVSARRQALRDLVLSDGTTIHKGDWTLSPQEAMSYDAAIYGDPHTFDGTRFLKPDASKFATLDGKQDDETGFVSTTDTWHFFGNGKIVCPGRFYSGVVMKLVLSHVLLNYDVKLVDRKEERSQMWRTTLYPKKDVRAVFTPRVA